MKTLPYRATTSTGDVFDIEFPLHDETVDAVKTAQLVSVLLESIDRHIAVTGEMGNGDVLQAMAMATAIRARMIHAPAPVTESLTKSLLSNALDASAMASRETPQSGHA